MRLRMCVSGGLKWPIESVPSGPTRFTADNLPIGKWICLADMDDQPGKFVKVVGFENGRAQLQDDDSMDRWGGKIEGEVYEESLPVYGWLQS